MEQIYKEDFPSWYEKSNQELILTDDVDSLLACAIIMKNRQANVSAFYDFEGLYYTDLYNWSINNALEDELIGVDCGLTHGKTYDNHVQQMNENKNINHESINFNVIDNKNKQNYYSKYCGSTAIMLYSLFDEGLPDTEEGKMILLAIDSTYKGFYSKWAESREAHRKYMVYKMGFGSLYSVLSSHNERDFINIIRKYNLDGKIWVGDDSKLHTNIKLKEISEQLGIALKLPDDIFILNSEYERKETDNLTAQLYEKAFSVAVTNKELTRYSIRKGE